MGITVEDDRQPIGSSWDDGLATRSLHLNVGQSISIKGVLAYVAISRPSIKPKVQLEGQGRPKEPV